MNFQEKIEDIEEQINEVIDSDTFIVSPQWLGLDRRCGKVRVDNNLTHIVADLKVSAIEYYGGFEYISKADKINIGKYTIYHSCSRVREHLQNLREYLRSNNEDPSRWLCEYAVSDMAGVIVFETNDRQQALEVIEEMNEDLEWDDEERAVLMERVEDHYERS